MPYSVGYHADASELAPNGWITGSEWDWDRPLHRHRADRDRRRASPRATYNGDYRVGLQTGDNPFIQSAFGAMVAAETIELIDAAEAVVRRRRLAVHRPGRRTRTATTVWAEGETPTYADIEKMDFFVEGVIGSTG